MKKTEYYACFDKQNYLVSNKIDIPKAVDVVNCFILYNKLPWLGVRGNLVLWIKPELSSRKFFFYKN